MEKLIKRTKKHLFGSNCTDIKKQPESIIAGEHGKDNQVIQKLIGHLSHRSKYCDKLNSNQFIM